MSNFVKTIYGKVFELKKSLLLLNIFKNYMKKLNKSEASLSRTLFTTFETGQGLFKNVPASRE